MDYQWPILAGLLMGLAASLHCAGMCGAIGSAVLFIGSPQADAASRTRILALTQAGRVLAYATAGGILGMFGASVAGAFDQAAAYRVLQWAAAATLGWIGLSTAGLVPAMLGFDRLAAPVGSALVSFAGRHPAFGAGAPVATGILWGFMPCAMVYGALFTAMLTGTGTGGLSLMFGFGVGTVPAVMASTLGLVAFRGLAGSLLASRLVGLAIVAFAVASVTLAPAGSVLCLPVR